MAPLVAAVSTCAVTLLLLAPTRRWLGRAGALDQPTERSSHAIPTLRGGGIAPALAMVAVLAVAGIDELAWPAAAFAALGAVEDLRGVPTLRRLAVQGLIGTAAAWNLMSGSVTLGWCLALLGTAISLTWFVNVFNFMDGIDGISVGQGVVSGLAAIVVGSVLDLRGATLGGAVLLGGACGFAPANIRGRRASMFLGDAGSYCFGGLIAVVVVAAVDAGAPVESMVAPLVPYLADTGTTLLRRMWQGERWLDPHRTHVYQRLVDQGLSHRQVASLVATLSGVAAGFGMLSLNGVVALRVAAVVGATAVGVVYLGAPRWLDVLARRGVVTLRPSR